MIRPSKMICTFCEVSFIPTRRKQGGGRRQKYCSVKCSQASWAAGNPDKRKAIVSAYERVPENKEKKCIRQRIRRLNTLNWTIVDLQKELIRQNFSCYGCLKPIDAKTARVDHKHGETKPRGLLCDSCNWTLGHAKESPATLRRLMSYLERDRTKTLIYLIGSLRNPRIPEVGNKLRSLGYDVMDEWFTPGELADENWQKYEALRQRGYAAALRGRSATNTFLFDRSYIDLADIVIMVAPAGKSAMIELGYAKGRGKHAWIFLDDKEPERFDIMPGFADEVLQTENDLIKKLEEINEDRNISKT